MTKTQLAILWGLSLAVVAVFALLARAMSRPVPLAEAPAPAMPTQVQEVHRLPQVPYSARGYYPTADQAARTWQGDAVLASAAADWAFAKLDDFSGAVEWTYQFYSPELQQLYVLSVGEGGAKTIMSTLSPYALPTIAADRWAVDSYEALGTWLDYGGAQFLDSHSVVDVSARLRPTADGTLEWSVVGMVRDQDTQHAVRVDATSGEFVE